MMKTIPQEFLNRFNAQLIKAGILPKDCLWEMKLKNRFRLSVNRRLLML